MKRTAVVAVALVLAAVAAAGCAGDDEEADAQAAGGLESGVLAASATADALAAPAAAAAGPGITVVGSGSARGVPDVAEWSFGVQTSGETAAAALAANSAAMDDVVAALRDSGIDEEDLQTEQVSVYPRTSDDGLTVVGYDASNTVRATIRDLDRAGPTVDAAVSAGANQVYGPTLTLSDSKAQYSAAVEAAFDDARARAEAIAAKAGVSLGAPVAIVEGGGGGVTPGFDRLAEAGAADVAVQPGTQEVGATLTVTFAVE
ncbi:MAG TPA: SIMPL domain-containing protein [Gaiellaceae bacterium]|nr:SIMPL domain-containing protein [Gaiellaceae bacterium]